MKVIKKQILKVGRKSKVFLLVVINDIQSISTLTKKEKKPLIFVDKIHLKRIKNYKKTHNENHVDDEGDEINTYNEHNLLLEWYERDQQPFLELGEMMVQQQG